MTEEELLRGRFCDLAEKAYGENRYVFSDFLNMAEISLLKSIKEISYMPVTLFGGVEGAERCMARFGSEALFGYTQDFPIACILAEPIAPKFSDTLTHRDFLGAILNAGIERSVIGDIIVTENQAYIFCKDELADYIAENLQRAKHTALKTSRPDRLPQALYRTEERTVQVASLRPDCLVAKVWNLSREDANSLFFTGKVFVNGKELQNNSATIQSNDLISVRGYGRFRFLSASPTRKGKLNAAIQYYV